MVRSSVFVAAVALVLAGCGDDGPDLDASPTPSSSASSTSSSISPSAAQDDPTTATPTATATPTPTATSSAPAPDPAARRDLRTAQRALLRANTGSVRTLMTLGPNGIDTRADYQLTSRSMTSHMILSSAQDGQVMVDTIGIDKGAWFKIRRAGDPIRSCWISADPEAIEQSTGVDLPRGIRGIPAGVLVAANAFGATRLDPSHVLARIDLYTAAGAFSGKLPLALGLDFHTKDTAPVRISVWDGAITGWRITLFDLLSAIESAGLELPDGLDDYADQDLSEAFVRADFSDLGKDVTVDPPPADLVVELSNDQDEFQQAMAACQSKSS